MFSLIVGTVRLVDDNIEKSRVENFFDEYFASNHFYNHCEKHGFKPSIGKIQYDNGNYVVDIMANEIRLESIFVDGSLKKDPDSISSSYLISMYKKGVTSIKDERKSAHECIRKKMLSYDVSLSAIENILDIMARRMQVLPDEAVVNTIIDTSFLGLDLASEVGLIYHEHLNQRYKDIAYHLTSVNHDISQGRKIHEAIDYLHINEEEFDGKIKIGVNIPDEYFMNRQEITTEYSRFIDTLLWMNLDILDEKIENSKKELEKLVEKN